MMKKYALTILVILSIHTLALSQTYYAIATGNWSNPSTWSTAGCGGAPATSVPGSGNDVVICSGRTVTLVGTESCDNLEVQSGATLDLNSQQFTVNGTTNLIGTITSGAGLVDHTFEGLITVNAGGNFDLDNPSNSRLRLGGGVSNNGTFNTLCWEIFFTNSQVLSGSNPINLEATNFIEVASGVSVTNQVDVTVNVINNPFNGQDATSTWVNAAGSSVDIQSGSSFMATGNLDASALNNEVIYARGGTNAIKAATYYNLTAANASVKRLTGATTVLGELSIIDAASFDLDGNPLSLHGDLINNSSFTGITLNDTGTGTLSMVGSASQTIGGTTAGVYRLENMTINKSGGDVILNDPLEAEGTVTLTSGKIITDATNILYMRLNAIFAGGGPASFVDGPVQKQTNSADFTYAIGKGTTYAPIIIRSPFPNGNLITADFFTGAGVTPNPGDLDTGIDAIDLDEYWSINSTGFATVELLYDDSWRENDITAPADLRVAGYNTGDGEWNSESGPAAVGSDAVSGSVSTTGLIDFSTIGEFTFGNAVGGGNTFTPPPPLSELYVSQSATGANNGSSWTDAFTNLEDALAIAGAGNSIYVAAGTYLPTQGYDVNTGSATTTARYETFRIPDGVKVYGGFEGNQATEFPVTPTIIDNRDFTADETILSGDIGTLGVNTDNAYHVVYTKNVSPTTTVDGFTITEGLADGGPPSNYHGGGWYNDGSGAGGVSNPVLGNCIFTNNQALSAFGSGGGMYNNGENGGVASPSLANCVFVANAAGGGGPSGGGGMFNNGTDNGNSSPILTNCSFRSNTTAGSGGGGIYNNGVTNGNSSPILTNCIFSNNSSGPGGGAYNNGNVGFGGTSTPIFTNCSFSGNTSSATFGDGIYNEGAAPQIVNCIFWGNLGSGQSWFNSSSTTTVEYTLIEEAALPAGSIDNGNNIFAQDPLFTNAASGTLTLTPCSPAIDAGSSSAISITEDAAGNPRVQGGEVDMGAFEATPTPLPEIALSGTGTTNFGIVAPGESRTLSYTIENTGAGVLNLGFSASGSTAISLSNTPTTVAAGASATFDVVFAPSVTGTASATITVNSNDCDEPTLSFGVSGTAANGFVTTWLTTAASETITVPTFAGETYNYTIDWGDGTVETITTDASPTHTYAAVGTQTITITGQFPRIYFNNSGDKDKIQTIDQWGGISWTSMENAFYGCTNLEVNATDAPNLSGATSMFRAFENCTSLTTPNLSGWDVSTIQTMYYAFQGCTNFNGDVTTWDVSGVQIFTAMFVDCSSFNQDISSWVTENATSMESMFNGASSFNRPIGGWDVSGVNQFNLMFSDATAFDQDLGNWDISNATTLGNALSNSGISVPNYDATLIGWAASASNTGITLGANNLTYCTAISERQDLIDNFGWTIIDAGLSSTTCLPSQPVGNRGLYFDGVDDHVILDNFQMKNLIDGSASLTVESWIKYDRSTPGVIFSHFRAGNTTPVGTNTGIFLRVRPDGSLTTDMTFGESYISAAGLVERNRWHHVAVVFDGTQTGNSNRFKLYLDGIEIPLTYNGTVPATVGSLSNGTFIGARVVAALTDQFPGQIDEVKIFNTARTEAQIQSDMISTSSSTTGLVGYWNLDDAAGTNADDLGTGNNDGTLTNDPFWAFRVTNTNDTGSGTLRQAIADANNNAGQTSYIDFSIPGPGPHTIGPFSSTVGANEPVIIDGYSQAGAVPNSNGITQPFNGTIMIEMDRGGSLFPSNPILGIFSPGSVIRGIAVYNSDNLQPGVGINLRGSNNKVEGCIIGSNSTGTAPGLGFDIGISTGGSSPGRVIGGPSPSARNYIIGNDEGIALTGDGGPSEDVQVQGNVIGLGTDASSVISNTTGINIRQGSSNNTVGGLSGDEGNIVRGNDVGIAVNGTFSDGNQFIGNSIYENTDSGIDLSGGTESVEGYTVNDADDSDTGPNNLQNFPDITRTTLLGSDLEVEFAVSSSASNSTYPLAIDFYKSDGNRQGEVYLDTYTYTTAQVTETITLVGVGASLTAGESIVATATDAASNTSEFSVEASVDAFTTDIVASATTTCIGASVTLTATASGTYLWSPTGQTTQSISVAPTTTTTYEVTVAGAATATATITVNDCQTIALSAYDSTATSVFLSWTGPATATYTIERAVGFGPFSPLTTLSGNTYLDTGLTEGEAYKYRITEGVNFSNNKLIVAGKAISSGYAIELGANTDKIVTDIDTMPSAYTLSLWVNPTGTGTRTLVSKSASPSTELLLNLNNDNSLTFSVFDNVLSVNTAAGVVPNGKWSHVAATFDGSNLEVFVDGISQGTNTGTPPSLSVNEVVELGTSNVGGGNYIGLLDDFRIWSQVLTAGEIQDRMAHYLRLGNQTDLYAHFRLDENGADSLNDVAGEWSAFTVGTATDWQMSGVPMGDRIVKDFSNPVTTSLTLTTPSGDSFTINYTSGNPQGAIVYLVESAPMNQNRNGLRTLLGDYYFGVFTVGGASPTYSLSYDYGNNPAITPANELFLNLGFRSNGASPKWAQLNATVDPAAQTITQTGLTGTEYIPGTSSCFSTLGVSQTILYVDQSVSPTGDGTSWGTAFTELREAMSWAFYCRDSSNVQEVWVAEGTYLPTDNIAQRDSSFVLVDGVAIYGGFPAGGDAFANRLPKTFRTILSGDLDGNDTDADADGLIDSFGQSGSNSVHVVVVPAGSSSATVLSGFYITGGLADGSFAPLPDNQGGGIFIDGASSTCTPILRRLTIQGNQASFGGGLYIGSNSGNVTPRIINTDFIDNDAVAGGAISLETNGTNAVLDATFRRNFFEFNTGANVAGAISASNQNFTTDNTLRATFTNAVFFDNGTGNTGGGAVRSSNAAGNGTGIVDLTFTNVTFHKNSTSGIRGGAVLSEGAAPTTATFNNSILWRNEATATSEIFGNGNATININNTLVDLSDVSALNLNTSNVVTGNPRFFYPLIGDLRPVTGSPAIDAGDNALSPNTSDDEDDDEDGDTTEFRPDIIGDDRIQNVTVNLGAYETPAGNKLLYVDDNGPFLNADGLSWPTALRQLTDALENANAGDSIVVADGTYLPQQGYDVTTGSATTTARYETFRIPDGVRVLGGFDGAASPTINTTTIENRDFFANESILSGDIDFDGIPAGNSYHVVYTLNASASTTVDGFTIRDGNADGTPVIDDESGGAWFNEADAVVSSPTIKNINFISNRADVQGGAFYNKTFNSGTASPIFTDVRFESNLSFDVGGAVYNNGTGGVSEPEFINAVFYQNNAISTGIIYNNDAAPDFTNSTFTDNASVALFNNSGGATPFIRNCIFWNNTGGSWANSFSSGPDVDYSLVEEDSVTLGPIATVGANMIYDTDPLFTNAASETLTLQAGSPAIDAGNSSTVSVTEDLAGNPRIEGTEVDMGAFEAQAAPVPVIFSVTPNHAPQNATVTIAGDNFATTAASNTVFFDGVQATVLSASATELTVIAPTSGNHGVLTVLTDGGIAQSSDYFSNTFINPPLGASSFDTPESFLTSAGSNLRFLTTGDLDGDGRNDIVVAGEGANELYIFRNQGTPGVIDNTTLAAPQTITMPGSPREVTLADLDNDGDLDIIASEWADDQITVLQNTSTTPGTITFNAPVTYTGFTAASGIKAADMDGDGKLDLLAAEGDASSPSDLYILRNTYTGIGNFTAGSFTSQAPISVTGLGSIRDIEFVDLTGDQLPELIMAGYNSNTLSVIENTSTSGSISVDVATPIYNTNLGVLAERLDIGDLNNDGLQDIIVTADGSGTPSALMIRNTSISPTVSFAASVSIADIGSGTQDVAIQDMDGDGRLDVLFLGLGSSRLNILRNTTTISTTITFAPIEDIPLALAPQGISLSDMDGDGVPDIVLSDAVADHVSILKNTLVPKLLYVDQSATGTNNGSSWTDAFNDLQDALTIATPGDTIVVADGTYLPSQGYDVNTGSATTTARYETFRIPAGVTMLGGWAGSESITATTIANRDFSANPTVLDGDFNGDDVYTVGFGASGTTLTTAGTTENAYHVVVTLNVGTSTTVDGFVVTGGAANSLSGDNKFGGGWYNEANAGTVSSPVIRNVRFIENETSDQGGGFYNLSEVGPGGEASPSFVNVVFERNLAGNGGGLYHISNGGGAQLNPVHINVDFIQNVANGGGALVFSVSNPGSIGISDLINVRFWRNTALSSVAGALGITAFDPTVSATITLINNTFAQNYAPNEGGAVYFSGNASSSNLNIQNSLFWGNEAANGDELYLQNLNAALDHSAFGAGGSADPSEVAQAGTVTITSNANEVSLLEDPFRDINSPDLRPRLGSRAVEAGDNAVVTVSEDIDGNLRELGVVELGASELPATSGPTIYVDQDATGAADGTSWTDAFTNLQDGLGQTRINNNAGPPVSSILVAAGTYYPTDTTARAATFEMIDLVSLYGGYDPGSGVTQTANRDWNLYPTILSGDIGAPSDSIDNSYHVVTIPPMADGMELDGFIIEEGNADGSLANNENAGGGIAALNNFAQVRVRNTILRNNRGIDGGAAYILADTDDAFLGFYNTIFHDNHTQDGGSVISAVDSGSFPSNLELFSSTIYGNTGVSATASTVFVAGTSSFSTARITNTVFNNNPTDIFGTPYQNTLDASNSAIVMDVEFTLFPDNPCAFADVNCAAGSITGTSAIFEDVLANDYRLTQSSPGVDAGDASALGFADTLDFALTPRVQGGIVDMGAYETAGLSLLYVDQSVTPTGDGSSWANAFSTLQEAISAATPGDTIVVAQGTYLPSVERDGTTDEPRRFTFELPDAVKIYGGFAGGEVIDQTALLNRDRTANETILSGDVDGNSTLDNGNVFTVVSAIDVSASTTLDGFTIEGGFADSTGVAQESGAGILVQAASATSSPVFQNLVIRNNVVDDTGGGGAGVAVITSSNTVSARFINVVFDNNAAEGTGGVTRGGGLFVNANGISASAEATLINNLFLNNRADEGGGLHNNPDLSGSANVTIVNSTFFGNEATYPGNEGGAIANANASGFGVIGVYNSLFRDNLDSFGGVDDFLSFTIATIQLYNVYHEEDVSSDPNLIAPAPSSPAIQADPQFNDPAATPPDLRLVDISPAVDVTSTSVWLSALGTDIGDMDYDGNTTEPAPFDITGSVSRSIDDGSGTPSANLGAYEEVVLPTSPTLPVGNRGMYFDGIDDYVSVNDAAPFDVDVATDGSDDFTIELWVKPDAVQPGAEDIRDLIGKQDLSGFPGTIINTFVLRYVRTGAATNEGKIYFDRITDDGSTAFGFSNTPIDDGGWHHVAFVKRSDSLELYIDGVLDITAVDVTTGTALNTENIIIGKRTPTDVINAFRGQLDEVKFWRVAKTPSQILAGINDVSTSASGLEAYWNFENDAQPGEQFIARDATLTGNDGDLGTVANGDPEEPLWALRVTSDDGTTSATGTINWVINEANTDADLDYVDFSISNSPTVQTIATDLGTPAITWPIFIDGYSAAGALQNTSAASFTGTLTTELTKSASASIVNHGLQFDGSVNTVTGSIIRGLSIYGFDQSGIRVNSAEDVTITGNWLGFDASAGAVLAGPHGIEIVASSSGTVIGGIQPAAMNVIANGGDKNIVSINSSNAEIVGNLIGVRPSGIPTAASNTIGISFENSSFDNFVNQNTIANHTQTGVLVGEFTDGNEIFDNNFFGNAQGIDLSLAGNNPDGLTPNDIGDADPGGNNLQNFPENIIATSASGTLDLTFTLSSATTATTYPVLVDVYLSDGNRQGTQLVASVTATTSGTTTVSTSASVAVGATIVTTATDAVGNTSEFSQDVTVEAAPNLALSVTGITNLGLAPIGGSSSVSYTITNTGGGTLDVTTISITGSTAFALAPTNTTLTAGASQTLTLIFAPSVTGTVSATVTLLSNDPDAPNVSFAVSGTGVVPGRLYVDSTQTVNTPDGLSWATAYPDLQSALTTASSGDDIWVANGTYFPAPPGDRSGSFFIPDQVNVLGGFTGFNDLEETLVTQRDPAVNSTILSGDINTDGTLTGNSYHVVEIPNTSTNIILDGFKVIEGNANSTGTNAEGGGIFIDGATGVLRQLVVENNAALNAGGGIRIDNGASITILEGRITGNEITGTAASDVGAGVSADGGSSVLIREMRIDNNLNPSGSGGGVHNFTTGGLVRIVNSSITNNTAAFGAGVYQYGTVPMQIRYSTISENNGWGVFAWTDVSLNHVTIAENTNNGVFANTGSSTFFIQRSILAYNGGGQDAVESSGGTIISGGENVVSNDPTTIFSSASDRSNTDPLLNPLTDNGGLTLTHSVSICSQAIDLATSSSATTDQIGQSVTRSADAGAFEFQGVLNIPEIALSGTGTTNFGNVAPGGSSTLTYTIENTGLAALTIFSISASGSTDFSLSGVPTTVAAGASETFAVVFAPTTIGTVTSTITVNSDDCDEPSLSFSVSGTGTNAAAITASATETCAGESVTLTASPSGSTYLWSGSQTTQSISVAPTVTTTYSVSVTTGGVTTSASVLITVNPLPVISATSSASVICIGESATLTASGSSTSYLWNTGPTGTTLIVSPTATTSYVVTGTDGNGCSASTSVLVTVNPLPVISATSSVSAICLGESATLTASGSATSYTWTPGGVTGATFVVSPTATTSYVVTGTDGNGCSATATVSLIVNPVPTASITPSTAAISPGSSITLTASGGTTYDWNTGATTSSILVSPAANTTFSVVVGTAAGCTATAFSTINVTSFDLIAVTELTPPSICGTSGNMRLNVLDLQPGLTYYVDLSVAATGAAVSSVISELEPATVGGGLPNQLVISSGLEEETIIGPFIGVRELETGRTDIIAFRDTLARLPRPRTDLPVTTDPNPISPDTTTTLTIENTEELVTYELVNLTDPADTYLPQPSPGAGEDLALETSNLFDTTTFIILAQDQNTLCQDTLRDPAAGTPVRRINVVVTDEVSESDSLVLVDIFNGTGGPGWINPWPLEEPISEWEGVETFGGCITRLDLSYRDLRGVLPASILSLGCLEYLNVAGNFLQFNSMEFILQAGPPFEFIYSPQEPVYEVLDTVLNEGDPVVFESVVGGTANRYQWFRNGVRLPGRTSDTLQIPAVDVDDIGQYTCEITNDIALLLTLERRPVNLDVIPKLNRPDSLWLVEFNQRTGGDNWRIRWDFTTPINTWYGLRFEGGELVEIALPNNNLSGSLPDIFEEDTVVLTDQIEVINLSGNALSGPLPPSIGEMEALRYLDLSNNDFTGAVPASYGTLESLTTLWLSGNALTSLPETITWRSMRNLFLNDNNLSTLPASLSNAVALEILDISNNPIAELPDESLCLPSLREFYANNMELRILPATLVTCGEPEVIEVYSNLLAELPDALLGLPDLRRLKVGDNRLDFGDLEPLVPVVAEEYTYAPQPDVNEPIDTLVEVESRFEMSVRTGGTQNRYQWLRNGEPIFGAQDSTYVIEDVSDRDAGIYTCRITNAQATELALERRPVVLNVSCRLAEVTIASDTPNGLLCENGENAITLRAPIGDFSYQWFRDEAAIFGAEASRYTTNQAGTYRVRLVDASGCQVVSRPFTLETKPEPVVELVLGTDPQTLSFTSSTEAIAFQWYVDNQPIPGATEETFRPETSGEYYLVIADANGCTGESDRLFFNVTGTDNEPLSLKTHLYPNPTDGTSLYLELPDEVGALQEVTLLDNLGRTVKRLHAEQPNTARRRYLLRGINDRTPAGVYFVRIQTHSGVILKELMVE